MMNKNALIVMIFVILSANTFAQTSPASISTEFICENESGIGFDYYTNRILTAKLHVKIDRITNDSLSYIKFRFTDEIRGNNYGYIYLSSRKDIDTFINDMTTAIGSLTQDADFESAIGKYKIDVEYIRKRKKTIKIINIHETIGGKAYFSISKENALKLTEWLKAVKSEII